MDDSARRVIYSNQQVGNSEMKGDQRNRLKLEAGIGRRRDGEEKKLTRIDSSSLRVEWRRIPRRYKILKIQNKYVKLCTTAPSQTILFATHKSRLYTQDNVVPTGHSSVLFCQTCSHVDAWRQCRLVRE